MTEAASHLKYSHLIPSTFPVGRSLSSPKSFASYTNIELADVSTSYPPPAADEAAGGISDCNSSITSLRNSKRETDCRPAITERLGPYLITTNIAGVLLIIAVINILAFLWFGDQENSVWRRIMIGGWVDQVVTLSTLAVRLAISTQAATALAMLASTHLEQNGVLLHNAPAMSIARYTNSGPLLSILPFWRELRRGPTRLVFAMVAALAISTAVLQLSSTILLWDIRPGLANGFEEYTLARVGYNLSPILNYSLTDSTMLNGIMRHSPNYWTSIPQAFPTFAEWNQPVVPEDDGVVDTGPTIRGLLPIPSVADREHLRTYNGLATLFDARVVCVRPNITEMRFSSRIMPVNGSSMGIVPPNVRGNIKPALFTGAMEQVLRVSSAASGFPFRCDTGTQWFNGSNVIQLCSLPFQAGGLINYLDPTNNASVNQFFDPADNSWKAEPVGSQTNATSWNVELGHAYILFNYTLHYDAWFEWGFGTMVNQSLTNSSYAFRGRGAWLDYASESHAEPLFSASLCYDAIYSYPAERMNHPQDFHIVAARESNFSEPVVGASSVTSRFDTPALQKQLGASKQHFPASKRGILQMDIQNLSPQLKDIQSTWNPNNSVVHLIGTALTRYYAPIKQQTYDFLNTLVWRPLDSNSPPNILIFCSQCTLFYDSSSNFTYLSSLLSDLFVSTLADTDNPALALQSLLTSLMRMAYYEWLPTFNVDQRLDTRAFKTCQIPQHTRGLAIVLSMLIVHLLLVAVVAVLFFRRTRYSLLNNAWQAVAQVADEPASQEIMARAKGLEDKNVRKWAEQDGRLQRRVWIRGNEGRTNAH